MRTNLVQSEGPDHPKIPETNDIFPKKKKEDLPPKQRCEDSPGPVDSVHQTSQSSFIHCNQLG
jgi:hypothetical protein